MTERPSASGAKPDPPTGTAPATAPPEAVPASDTVDTADAVIDFWFADPASGRRDLPQSKRWFAGGRALDAELRARFVPLILAAARGERDAWRERPAGALALIVLLDQFPRHVWRGTARAFAHGGRALEIAEAGIDRGDLGRLPLVQGVFYCLPLGHDESPASQRRALALLRRLRDGARADLVPFAQATLDSAEERAAIVERFGRYPHRNAALGRESTPEERAWLAATPRRFGQRAPSAVTDRRASPPPAPRAPPAAGSRRRDR